MALLSKGSSPGGNLRGIGGLCRPCSSARAARRRVLVRRRRRSAALQQACAASSQRPVAQASSFVGCDALQHVAAGGGSLLPSMLLISSLALHAKRLSVFENHRSDRGTTVQTLHTTTSYCRKTGRGPPKLIGKACAAPL